ncbi:hypothetical protein C8F04DRAFT_518585 [Mycena alexandri]|uniref:Uncharacterized protein n=1 Tax=Mycena alexandri TaxID=1745969 RepID=A0AAD6TIL7_9AGAR|nr:hypothetical protein C8F04DRAFT_518585 [Mycena alexandri]
MALACTDVAEVLGPVLDWSVTHTPIQTSRIILEVQAWLRSSLPPLVVIAPSEDGSETFPEITFRDDLEGYLNTFQSLPQKPAWPMNVHRRDRGLNAVPMIILSTELVGWLLATIDATDDQVDAAIRSRHAATASIKTTVVHELSHLWVMEKHLGDSPRRKDVIGAEGSKYDAAEDEKKAGVIEAGNLVETAWLGGPHKLALDNDGWLRFVVYETTSTSSATSASSARPSSVASSSSSSSSVTFSGDTESDFSTDEECVPSAPSSSGPSSPLGSPFQIQPLFHDPAIAAVEEQDRIHHVRICNDEILESLWAPGLPRLSGGIVGHPSPFIRAKGYHRLQTPSPTPPPTPLPTQRQRPDNLFAGEVVPLYLRTEGLPPKWPSVFGRQSDHTQSCTTPK